ncbi:phage major capsid protein, partial [Mobiluncus curtisii]|nr:phage major capsid protein [Mobiluncus curtisii]
IYKKQIGEAFALAFDKAALFGGVKRSRFCSASYVGASCLAWVWL